MTFALDLSDLNLIIETFFLKKKFLQKKALF
jgi:hypothetical protein